MKNISSQFFLVFSFLSICLFCIFSCLEHHQYVIYPEIIIKNNKQEQYDIAKAEMYKISNRHGCNCTKIEFFDSDGRTLSDTISIISMNINLDTLYFRGDSTTYLFSFYYRNKTEYSYTLNDQYNSCPNYYGVEFVKGSKLPYRYLIAENSYLDREAIANFNFIDSSFYDCLINNKKIANKWLLEYFKIK